MSNNVVTKVASSTINYGTGTSDDYWDYYLNNTWYNSFTDASRNMLTTGTYYLGKIIENKVKYNNYKDAICKNEDTTDTTKECVKTTSVWTGYVGLPRYGEMFSSQQEQGYSTSTNFFLITPANLPPYFTGDGILSVDHVADVAVSLSDKYAVRPSLYLKSTVKITGGDGTKSNPFTISD